jgi:hypothetical protein
VVITVRSIAWRVTYVCNAGAAGPSSRLALTLNILLAQSLCNVRKIGCLPFALLPVAGCVEYVQCVGDKANLWTMHMDELHGRACALGDCGGHRHGVFAQWRAIEWHEKRLVHRGKGALNGVRGVGA